jgi:hypothetical protein
LRRQALLHHHAEVVEHERSVAGRPDVHRPRSAKDVAATVPAAVGPRVKSDTTSSQTPRQVSSHDC